MEKELTTLSSKGQLVVPKLFRQKLGLKAGEFLGMVLIDDIIAIKKVDMPEERIEKKLKKAEDDREFVFEEMLYPEKK